MDFEASPMEKELRELARKFALKEIAPFVEEDERTETFRPELIAKLGELGLTGIPLPEEYGGAGLGYQEYVAVIEELASVNAGYAISVAVTGLAQMILKSTVPRSRRRNTFRALASGQAIGAFGLSEAVRRLGRGRASHDGAARGRSLHHQRHEALGHAGRHRRNRAPHGPHRGARAERHLDIHHRARDAGI